MGIGAGPQSRLGIKAVPQAPWLLIVYSAGPGGRRQLLRCATNPQLSRSLRITGQAPAVHGHPAFWAGGYLLWQYARGGWAILTGPGKKDLARVASGVRHGAARTPGRFATQLTGVPASWRASTVGYVPDGGVLRGEAYQVDQQGANDLIGSGRFSRNHPDVLNAPTAGRGCAYRDAGKSRVINGHHVVVTLIRARNNSQGVSYRQLCADADGLRVIINVAGLHPALGVVSIFAHQLRILGTNPANWATRPIG
jgi:hypothetical protein